MEEYILAKKIVSKIYDSSYEYFNLFVVSLTGLLIKYTNYKDIIEELFTACDIYIEHKGINEILANNNIETNKFPDDDGINVTRGTSSGSFTFSFDKDFNFVKETANPFIACNANCSSMELLNTFIHEFNHLIKGYMNNYYMDDEYHCMRSGLEYCKIFYDREIETLYQYNYHRVMDEVINTIQTTEIIENICGIESFVDEDCKKYLDSLDKDMFGVDCGYNICVKLFRKIWRNETFRKLIEDNIVEGNMENIINGFDDIVGFDSFNDLSNLLDDLDDLETLGYKWKNSKVVRDKINSIISDYNKKTMHKTFQKSNNVIEYRR